MRIYTQCTNCSEEISYKTRAKTRVDLVMQEGEQISIECWNCSQQQERVPNDFVAKPEKLAQWVAGFIFLFGTIGLVFFFLPIFELRGGIFWTLVVGALVLTPLSAWHAINKQDRERVNVFNRNRLG